MAPPPRTVRIAMLNTDMPVPSVHTKLGTYGDIFHDLLSAAASRIAPNLKIESVNFDVVRGEYPARASDFDVLLITGSAASAYDDVEWVHKLNDYLREVFRSQLDIKMFGSCFGHQIICQSLLKEYGVFVERDVWEIGVHDVHLTEEFFAALGADKVACPLVDMPPTPDSADGSASRKLEANVLRMQLVHADHVRLPATDALPAPWISMGRSNNCAIQGIYNPGRVLTYQAHFEFDRFINAETVKVFGARWEPQVLQKALEAIEAEDDALLAAEMVVRFIQEPKQTLGDVSGLDTPPVATTVLC